MLAVDHICRAEPCDCKLGCIENSDRNRPPIADPQAGDEQGVQQSVVNRQSMAAIEFPVVTAQMLLQRRGRVERVAADHTRRGDDDV